MEALVILALYFVPSIIAQYRQLKNKEKIFLANLLIGWTIIGWIIEFFIACGTPKQDIQSNSATQEFAFAKAEDETPVSNTQGKIQLKQNSITKKVDRVSIKDNRSHTSTENENLIKCPKCKSTQLTANKKGYGWGKGVAGGVALGPVGLAAGAIGSKDVKVTCLSCGFSWKPEERAKIEREQSKSASRLFGECILYAILLLIAILFIYALNQG